MLNQFKKPKIVIYSLIFLLPIFLLSGCGFKLRSQNSLPPAMHTIYYQVDNPYGSLEIALKTALKGSDIHLVEKPSDAPITMYITATNFSYTQTSIGPSNQARIYHLVMSMSLSLVNAKGKTVLAVQPITSVRDLTLSANEVFETSGQVDVAKLNMQQEIIMKIFDVLSSKRVFKALA